MKAEYNRAEGVLDLFITQSERANYTRGLTIRTSRNLPSMGHVYLRESDNVDSQEAPRILTNDGDIQIRLPSYSDNGDGNTAPPKSFLDVWEGERIPFTAEELGNRYPDLKFFVMHFVPDKPRERPDKDSL